MSSIYIYWAMSPASAEENGNVTSQHICGTRISESWQSRTVKVEGQFRRFNISTTVIKD